MWAIFNVDRDNLQPRPRIGGLDNNNNSEDPAENNTKSVNAIFSYGCEVGQKCGTDVT